jgi:hypothetical protein
MKNHLGMLSSTLLEKLCMEEELQMILIEDCSRLYSKIIFHRKLSKSQEFP